MGLTTRKSYSDCGKVLGYNFLLVLKPYLFEKFRKIE